MEESKEDNVKESEMSEPGNHEDNVQEAKIFEFFEEGLVQQKVSYGKVLLSLYELTKIDEELADIDDEKGDLPVRIEDLKERMVVINEHLAEDKLKLKNFESEEKVLMKENKNLDEKVTKYDESKYKAKNNKEYDGITKQIETMMETIEKNEARLKELKSYQENLVKGILEMSKSNDELKAELKEDTSQLNSLNKQFADEENELIEKRKAILDNLTDKQKNLYERINGSLKGEATAIVRKGNCSGCYNSVPPQREIEIRMAEDIFLCQSCGRIMIDEKLIENL
jgi:predicted  nucleic acid-binding Zn-ribbon protein